MAPFWLLETNQLLDKSDDVLTPGQRQVEATIAEKLKARPEDAGCSAPRVLYRAAARQIPEHRLPTGVVGVIPGVIET